jgi:hypothetical protein
MKRLYIWLAIVLSAALGTQARAQARYEIQFPDLPEYEAITCDLHMHSVFSDGSVWPTVRVDEAWRLGLDAIALTDHIEYQPHQEDVPTKHNRPYELAAGPARQRNLLLPRAAEITRDTPPGHFNAIFLDDVNPVDTEEFLDAIRQANQQGAFVFWNHQGWKGAEAGRWLDVHTQMYDNGWLHGMEVCNGDGYHPDAHKWCLEKGLTMLGTSDIHGPDLNEKTTPEEHRTLTLAFVKERTLEGLKEALVEGRTVVWFQDQLIGKREWLEALLAESVCVARPHLRTGNAVLVEIRNACDVEINLQRTGDLGPPNLTLPARAVTLVKIGTPNPTEPLELSYTATNLLIGPEEGLPVTLRVAD